MKKSVTNINVSGTVGEMIKLLTNKNTQEQIYIYIFVEWFLRSSESVDDAYATRFLFRNRFKLSGSQWVGLGLDILANRQNDGLKLIPSLVQHLVGPQNIAW